MGLIAIKPKDAKSFSNLLAFGFKISTCKVSMMSKIVIFPKKTAPKKIGGGLVIGGAIYAADAARGSPRS